MNDRPLEPLRGANVEFGVQWGGVWRMGSCGGEEGRRGNANDAALSQAEARDAVQKRC